MSLLKLSVKRAPDGIVKVLSMFTFMFVTFVHDVLMFFSGSP